MTWELTARRGGQQELLDTDVGPVPDAETVLVQLDDVELLKLDRRRLVHLSGPRKPALSNRLADVLFVLSGPGVHADLTGDRGWTSAAYEAWLTTTIEALLAS